MHKFLFVLLLPLSLCFNIEINAQQVVDIQISGNEITKSEIILNELGISIGDTLSPVEFQVYREDATNRLENLSLFLWVKIAYELSGEKVVLLVNVKERWYYWMYPILEHADRNFSSFLNSKDWSRINYGVSFEKHNFRGRNEFLKLKLRFGYRSQFGLMYDNPAIDKRSMQGMQFSFDYFMQDKLIYSVLNDRPLYVFSANQNMLKQSRVRVVYQFRLGLDQKVNFMLEYNNFSISPYLDSLQVNFVSQDDLQSEFLSAYVKYSFDKRNVKYYPTSGFNLVAKVGRQGLSLLSSNVDLLQASFRFNYYWPITNSVSLASEGYCKAHLANKGNIPFLYAGMLGYDFYPRGYEYNLVLGNAIGGISETMRIQVYNSPELFNKVIPFDAFKPFKFSVFLSAFFDLAYVVNSTGDYLNQSLDNQALYSGGLGIDFVSYYDRSIGVHMAVTNQNAFGIFATLRSPLYKNF